MKTTRRNFLSALAAVLPAGAPALQILSTQELPASDVGKLLLWIDIYGEEAVCQEIITVSAAGDFNIKEIKRRLNRHKNRERRQRQAARRRERHIGDQVLYHGPITFALDIDLRGRCVKTAHNRRVDILNAPCDYVLLGVLRSCPDGYHTLEDDNGEIIGFAPEGDSYPIDDIVLAVEDIRVPCGSRILTDLRHGWADTMLGEIVCAPCGDIRMHLWLPTGGWVETDGSEPVLAFAS